ncbi:TetR/AcrR family transcriptional regulator [Ralstonia pseudosolanacearum]|uniref:TetR/AcrR family transcriptional regulator n=1 Tax=Ralstonia pseudosolanacearum TaxID=1310165 RepID=UPI0008DAC8CA|nr:TetR/AcrR family transcriptional regulator [Ralstonia pseudosolanacearum]MCL1621990.1 TetR/AcrR family transcriptional regulator [Ralstonia pseudosolanacearum CaRs-Mep]
MRTIDPVKHEKRRQEILAAADRCFRRDGFRGASISNICAEARMSSGHLYHYFSSKEEILRTIVETGLMRGTARVEEMMASLDPIGSFIDQAEKTRHGQAGQSLVLDMLAEAGHNPAVAEIVRDHSREVRSLLTNFLRTAQEKGQVDSSLDADMAAAVLLAVVDGAQAMTIRDPKLNKNRSFANMKLLISRFLKPQ